MSNCAIVGINWGDENKGRIKLDYLTQQYDVGEFALSGRRQRRALSSAEKGKFALHLLPSGIFRSAS